MESRFTEAQIMSVLRQAEGGVPVPELCREHQISSATIYKWRSRYGGMDASMISAMKGFEDANRHTPPVMTALSVTCSGTFVGDCTAGDINPLLSDAIEDFPDN